MAELGDKRFGISTNRQTYGQQVRMSAPVSDALFRRIAEETKAQRLSRGELIWQAAVERGADISQHYEELYGGPEAVAQVRGRRQARSHHEPYRQLYFYLPTEQAEQVTDLAYQVGAKSVSDLISRLLRLHLGLPLPTSIEGHDPA